MLQIEIYSPKSGEDLQPVQSNLDELKAKIVEGLKKYENIVYTDETMSMAKKDRADLNRLAKVIDDERIAMKRRYLAPYQEFEDKAKELTGLINAQSAKIDEQVKEFEKREKDQKQTDIKAIYDEVIGDLKELVPYEKIHDAKWLNKGTSLKAVKAAIEDIIGRTSAAFTVINKMGFDEQTTNRVKAAFLRKFDLSDAIAEKEKIEDENRRIAEYELKKAAEKRAREEAAAQAVAKAKSETSNEASNQAIDTGNAQESINEPISTEKSVSGELRDSQRETLTQLDFRVWATKEQLAALKNFLVVSGIKYGRVQ